MTQNPGGYSIGSDVWPGASKVIEEMGEALQVLGKLIGASGSTEYWGGVDLRAKLVEELSDVLATIAYFSYCNLTIQELVEIDDRSEEKRLLFEEWHINGHDSKDKTRSIS